MIPIAYINEWRQQAPWQDDYQVEQDLIICRALAAIFSDQELRKKLAFRGGTALHKIYISPSARYSEDVDLVQISAEPFGPVIDRLRDCLAFLGTPLRKQKAHNNTMIFRLTSEAGQKMKLKIEVNTREHFTVFGHHSMPFKLDSAWHTQSCSITTFTIEELLSTKLRALYQRKKGRDLFDLWYALTQLDCDPKKIVEGWRVYMKEEGNKISRREFEMNLDEKLQSPQFMGDMGFLIRSGIEYDIPNAAKLVKEKIITLI
ncbi:nucleotidyl transferase AbiEii/AbiGii toxin family protein [Parapedobacter tibetensis]|uniref:nucleotidyl transferase AbiEii/AbiGii toxin family protein n=1 Tax=Parapedobacter tibetensis TaxID=2972951 RepID=UPI00214D9E1C|nr:nucleotidyl transferase AbiEii/AbiGii toxin family protein [Parapedobacter tibetensis]